MDGTPAGHSPGQPRADRASIRFHSRRWTGGTRRLAAHWIDLAAMEPSVSQSPNAPTAAGADRTVGDAAQLGGPRPGADMQLRFDAQGTISTASVGRVADIGSPSAKLIGRRANDVLGAVAPAIDDLIQRAVSTGEPQTFSFLSADQERWLSAQVTPLVDGETLLTARDVTAEHTLLRRLEFEASHDSLTDLPNRLSFNDRLEKILGRRPVRAAVLLIDLDEFKLVNDVAGQSTGDELLKLVAERLTSSIRRPDIAARLGADEFAVLLDDISRIDDALAAARHLQDDLRQPYEIDGASSVQACSIGVTLVSADDTITDVMRRADVALLAAKNKGKASIASFDSDLFELMRQRHGLVQELERAISNGELSVVYQPIVHLETGEVSSVEILSRWSDHTGTPVSPEVFVRAAEDHGLIDALLDATLRLATADARPWFDRAPELSLHVNVSPVQMRHEGLADQLSTIVADGLLVPQQVSVEITESVLALDIDATRDNLAQLVDKGFSICLDDFGTGYSSLSYLHRFAPEVLKLDKSFVRQMTESGDTRLPRAILGLARDLDIEAVVEGIETEEEWRILRDLGWTYGQGFFMSGGVKAAEFDKLLGTKLLP